MEGKIILNGPINTGMVRFGSHRLGTQDQFYSRSIWEVYGTVVINGCVGIGRGCKISVGREGILSLGNNFKITGKSEIICKKEITFGDDCLLSWDILMMDSDMHSVINEYGDIINYPRPIYIGNHVWIGCRTTILKGVSVADDNIIAANSLLTISISDKKCIIAGHGKQASIIKRFVSWKI